ncbi:unnamed protein product [Wickerhamomyces anomalus]
MSEITEPKLDDNQEDLVDNNQSIQNTTNPNEDLDDDDEKPSSARERRKIEIRFIQDKSRRHITFSKRKAGIMKKAYELSVLTGTQVLLLVVSETGLVYTFTTPKLQPLVTKPEGKNLIQACLNAPEESGEDEEASTPTNSTSQQSQNQQATQHNNNKQLNSKPLNNKLKHNNLNLNNSNTQINLQQVLDILNNLVYKTYLQILAT